MAGQAARGGTGGLGDVPDPDGREGREQARTAGAGAYKYRGPHEAPFEGRLGEVYSIKHKV